MRQSNTMLNLAAWVEWSCPPPRGVISTLHAGCHFYLAPTRPCYVLTCAALATRSGRRVRNDGVPAVPIIIFIVGALLLYVTQQSALYLPLNLAGRVSALWSGRAARAAEEIATVSAVEKQKISHKKFIIQSIISLVLLLAALFMILSSTFTSQDKHWAFGTIGTIVGFWLKG
jgi:hypothetical protein